MIYVQRKPYQLVLRGSIEHLPDLVEDFDTLEGACAKLAQENERGAYTSGVVMHWQPREGSWTLVDQFGINQN